MKQAITFRNGIEAALNAMHRMLKAATEDTRTAWEDIARNEQNMAIGAIIAVEERLNEAMALYKAIIAMHRCKL